MFNMDNVGYVLCLRLNGSGDIRRFDLISLGFFQREVFYENRVKFIKLSIIWLVQLKTLV